MIIDEATLNAFKYYRDMLISKGVSPEDFSENMAWRSLTKQMRLSHALWMCEEILKPEAAHYSLDKRSRWLGFVQSILVCEGLATIKNERNRTRPWLAGKKVPS